MRGEILLAVFLLAACGGSTSQVASSTRSSPSVTSQRVSPVPSGILFVIKQQISGPDQTGSLSLVTEGGHIAQVLPLPPNSNVLAVAGGRIFISTGDGTLEAIRRDGTIQTLSTIAGGKNVPGALAASPDGTRWLWALQSPDTTTQAIFEGGDGLTPREIARLPYPTVLIPYAWTTQGVVMDSEPMDYFGYKPFNTAWMALGGMQLVNPVNGAIEPFKTPSQCIFSDIGRDGTIVCFPTQPGYLVSILHTLRIVRSSGMATDINLSLPRFKYVGDAYFSPDGSTLTVAGATGAGVGTTIDNSNPQLEQYGTDLVHVADASIVRFGPVGARPAMGRQSWLPDGELVLWRPNDVNGPAGLYVLDPHGSGQGTEIVIAGTPIGYLTG